MSTEQAVLKIIADISSQHDITLESELFDSGLIDSMGLVQVLVAIENEIGCYIPITEINRAEVFAPIHFIKLIAANKQ